MKHLFSCLAVLFIIHQSFGQKTYYFEKGLAIGPCNQYGREALYTDQLAYQLYSGTLKNPAAGTVLYRNLKGEEISWKEIKADSAHRFRGDAFTNGYVHLTYDSPKEQAVVLTMTGHDMVFVNGAPRGGDMYRYGWMHLPVMLKKGRNEFYARVARFGRFGGVTANIAFPEKPVSMITEDVTLPDIVSNAKSDSLWAGIVVQNVTKQTVSGARIYTEVAGRHYTTLLPDILPMSIRKVAVLINGSGVSEGNTAGTFDLHLSLNWNGREQEKEILPIKKVGEGMQYSRTFISALDGSVQYYAISPQINPEDGKAPALFLSVHGAEVQAINQARAYKPKDWGVLVAPTNRRPRGFNWEDWGRQDALEVFEIAKREFKPDPSRIYLTGHSMGGHGTWFLGATYPEKWAAIAPSAGYPNLSSYGSHDGMIPDSAGSPMEAILLRASNASNILKLTSNYKSLGVYVAHGDADKTVPVTFARQMRDILGKSHRDFSYYEHIGGEHWYGDISVDWPPLFNFFSWHTIPADTAVSSIDFMTANPGISSKMRWASIIQQGKPLEYSRVQLNLDKKGKQITGKTDNVALLSLQLGSFTAGTEIKVILDSLPALTYEVNAGSEKIYLQKTNKWEIVPAPSKKQKNEVRSGTFKDAFKNNMVFVYATGGSKEEKSWALDKARFDAESWYYRGNGAVEMVMDRDFDPAKFKDLGVILYGNQTTNLAWNKLLADCPMKVTSGKVKVGDKEFSGTDLATYFIWPRADSDIASVAVIGGTGLKGFQAANANQYFSGGSGFPDLMIFSQSMLDKGISGVKMSGFFGNDWSANKGDFVTQ